jgi:hypothetical protein
MYMIAGCELALWVWMGLEKLLDTMVHIRSYYKE